MLKRFISGTHSVYVLAQDFYGLRSMYTHTFITANSMQIKVITVIYVAVGFPAGLASLSTVLGYNSGDTVAIPNRIPVA